MEFKKAGLSLGGGGGKGAYQAGVLKALHKFGFDDDIKAIAGTSIGSLNISIFGTNINNGENLWSSLSRKQIFTKNKRFKSKKFGLYSREGMEKIISENIDLEAISKRESPSMYVTATNAKTNEEKIFKLNGKSKDEIMSYMEASSAIPFVFVPSEIDGEVYVDGGLKENLPMSVLLEQEKCDLIFMVPVLGVHLPDENSYPDCTIIDFRDIDCEEVDLWNGILGFSAKITKARIEAGYIAGKALLRHLIRIGLLPQRSSGIKPDKPLAEYKKYYSLKDVPEYNEIYNSKSDSYYLRLRRKIIGKIVK